MTMFAIVLITLSALINAVCIGLACSTWGTTKAPAQNLFWAWLTDKVDHSWVTNADLGITSHKETDRFGLVTLEGLLTAHLPTRTQRAYAWIGRQATRLEAFINACNQVDTKADKAIVARAARTWEDAADAMFLRDMARNTTLRTELTWVEKREAACAASFNAASIRRGWMELVGLDVLTRKVNAFIAA